MTNYKTIAFIALAPAMALPHLPAAAQASTDTALEEVVVTAQRREENLLSTPVAVSAFSESALAGLSITNTAMLADFVPNLTISVLGGSPNAAGTFIRGQGTLDPQLTDDVRVGTYIDGVYLARMNNTAFELADIERVEVLRGPQGTLFGRNTTGGAVNVITRGPGEESGLRVQASAGSRGYWRGGLRLDTGMQGSIGASINYLATERDGWVNNSSTRAAAEENAGADDTRAWRLALAWQPTDTVSVKLTHQDIDAVKTGFGTQISSARPAVPDLVANASQNRLSTIAMDYLEEDDTQSTLSSLQASWVLGNFELKSITGIGDWDHKGFSDQDGGEYFTPAGERSVYNLSRNDEEQEQFTQELQLIGDFSEYGLDLILGAFYFEEETEARASAITGAVDTAPSTDRFVTTDNQSSALYGQVGWRPFGADGRFKVTGGLRYSKDDKEASQVIDFTSRATGLRDRLSLNGEDDWDNLDWTAIVSYDLQDATHVYLKSSSAYKSGGFNIRDTGFNPDTGEPDFENPFGEETLITWELGMKSELFERRLRISAAAFYTEFDDIQLNVSPPISQCLGGLFCSRTENAGEAEMSGIEAEFEALLGGGFSLRGSLGYIDTEVTEFVDSQGVDRSDTAGFPATPDWDGSLGLSFTTGLGELGEFYARIDASYRDDILFIGSENNADLYGGEDRTLVNARMGLADVRLAGGTLEVAAWGRNILDEEYRSFGIDLSRYTNNTYGEPATFGVDLTWDY